MPLSPERIAQLDQFYSQSNQPDYLSQLTDKPQGISPQRMAELDAYYSQKQPQEQDVSIGRTALDQGMQGATFGFADEAMDTIGSLGAGAYMKAFRPDLMDGQDLGTLYSDARGMSKNRLNAEMAQNPVTSIASNIGGALLTGGAGVSTKAGAAAANSLRAGNTAARIAKGAIAGSASGGLYGAGTAEDGQRLEGAEQGAIYGGVTGGAIPAIGATGRAALNAVTPTIEEGMRPVVALAQKYNIPVSLSQVTNSNAVKNFQKVSSQLPLSGENAFRQKQLGAFNKALINTVGGNSNKFTPELMDNLFTKVGKEFDDFGKGKNFNLNDDFIDATSKLTNEADAFTNEGKQKLQDGIAKIFSEADENGVISGEKLGKLRNKLNQDARKASKIKNYESQEIFHDLENAIVDTIKGGDDVAGQAFSKTKQKYKNLLVLEPLATKSKGGNISATQLQSRVSKIYGRQFTRGNAGEIGELARIGHEIMPELGGSDTTEKALYTIGANGLFGPARTATAIGTNRLAQEALRNQSMVNLAMKKSRLASSSPMKITIHPEDKYPLPRVNLP